jgi:SSS family solute:Na+ symporter
VNAWCEVVAMISSFAVSLVLLSLARNGIHFSTHIALIVTIIITSASWLVTAFAGPETDRKVLIEFYRKVLPFGPGWRRVREEAGITEEQARATHENIPMALLGWVAGCTTIWSALFAVGNFLYGRLASAFTLLAIFVLSGLALIYLVNRLWAPNGGKSPVVRGAEP